MECGPPESGRGHADLTHIPLYYRGCPILVDSGRYSYIEEKPLHPFLKSARIHNVYVMDKEPHGRPRGSWGYDSFGQGFKSCYREQGPIHYGEMTCHGCLMSDAHYLVIHKVMAMDQGIRMAVNDIRCDGGHEVKEYYHLNSTIRGTPMGTGTGGAGECQEPYSGGYDVMTVLGSRPFEAVPCVISKQYNQREESTCLTRETGSTDRIADWTCLFGEGTETGRTQVFQYGNSRPEMEEQVTVINFYLSSDRSWDFLMQNQET